MPGLIITNPVHIEYLLEHGTVNLAVSLGLDTCPLCSHFCSHFGSVTVLQDDSPTAILHAFAGTADCLETRTCHHCFDEGLGDPPEEGEPGLHTPARDAICAPYKASGLMSKPERRTDLRAPAPTSIFATRTKRRASNGCLVPSVSSCFPLALAFFDPARARLLVAWRSWLAT